MTRALSKSIVIAAFSVALLGAQVTKPARVGVGEGPEAIAFDGVNIWVANEFNDSVTKLTRSGAALGTFPVGRRPLGLATDGKSLWVANYLDDTVTRLRVEDGGVMGTYTVGNGPAAIIMHSDSVWVANRNDNTVSRLDAATGAPLAAIRVGRRPIGLAAADVVTAGVTAHFVLVTNNVGGNVTRIRESDNVALANYRVGDGPFGVAWDGATMWVANYFSQNVMRLAVDGSIVGIYPTGDGASGIVFDGDSVWVANNGSNTITRLRATDGGLLETIEVGSGPFGVVFDGEGVWVANVGSDDVAHVVKVAVKGPPIMPTGLVLALGFNEPGGATAVDASPSRNSAEIAGATRVAGKAGFGTALSFNGVNSIVRVRDSMSLALNNAMTLEAWVNPTALAGFRTVLLKEGPTGMAYELYANDPTATRPAAYYTTPNGVLRGVTGTPTAANTWTHLAATYDGASMRFYVNGVAVRDVSRVGNIVTTGGPLHIGGNTIWGGEFFAGLIDDVRVYNRALTQAEIARDMSTSLP